MSNEFFIYFLEQVEYFLRILIAGLCGTIIGYERKNRMKEAGVRTHLIVAIGSALMMIVSKYGFSDTIANMGKADASRIASQIVTGVGFLGAGTIFVRKNAISGLTTAAGIWATAGIGMAIGSGMYSIGIATAITITIIQFVFHGHLKFLNRPSVELITIKITAFDEALDYVRNQLKCEGIEIINIRMDKSVSGNITLDIQAKFPSDYDKGNLLNVFISNDNVKTIDF